MATDSEDKYLPQLEQALLIDENELDQAIKVQSELFYRVAKRLALVISKRDAAKQEVSETEARLSVKIRHDAEVAEEKVTEKSIESQVRLHKDMEVASDELLAMNSEVGKLAALKEAYQQRNYMLKALVDLYISGYFGGDISGVSNKLKNETATTARVKLNHLRIRENR